MEDPVNLPYKSVVLFVACGTMVFIIVFLFAKRQIIRFALKSNRVPHAAIGANAPKSMKQEIERRLKRVTDIAFEPLLLSPFTTQQADYEKCHFYFRMKALDSLKTFDKQLDRYFPSVKRSAGLSLRLFLLDLRLPKKGALHGIAMEIIEKFCELYDHARHNPAEFRQEHYQEFMDLLSHLTDHIHKRYAYNTTIDDITDSINHGVLNNDTSDASEKPNPISLALNPVGTEEDSKLHSDLSHSDIRLMSDEGGYDVDTLTGTVAGGCRDTRANEGDTGCLLLEGRDSSGSSQASLTHTEVTYRGTGVGGSHPHSYL